MKEVQDQLEAEQYFSRLYKTQSCELREDLDDRTRSVEELEEERSSLLHQLQIALARADSEALARSIAEETVADLEKEKTMKELELKDLVTKHRNENSVKESSLQALKDSESELNKKLSVKLGEVDDLIEKNKKLLEEVQQFKTDQAEIEKLQAKLKTESLLKQTAVNKLAEIMARKDGIVPGKQKTKVSATADLKKKDKELRRMQLELTQEKDKLNQMIQQKQELHNQLLEERQVCFFFNHLFSKLPYFFIFLQNFTSLLALYIFIAVLQNTKPGHNKLFISIKFC